ncbi:hypothetical protein G9P44_006199 [Scheffersomyces stipitis]|nr:hypothetical protein G9P44_006199 [Scheffersomyces stipitis]
MSVYQRYASGDHDEQFFSGRGSTPPIDGLNHSIDYDQEETENSREKSPPTEPVSPIVLHPLSGHFDETVPLSSLVSEEKWLDLSSKAAYFQGYDHLVFGHVVTIVFQHSKTNKISTKSITKYGISTYDNIILDSRSRFWPSCENLLPEYQKSNVRRALAITNLKNYSRLINNSALLEIDKNKWDETVAGELANSMQLMGEVQTPQDLGAKLLQLGLVQLHKMPSTVIDVVYDNSPQTSTPQIVEENNKLVYLIGEQLEQLFDPLLEYSPEAMQISYAVPDAGNHVSPLVSSEKIDSVISELITVQTNFTMGLVNLLQDFIIPLRISVLSSEANSGIAKLNSVFPPTIDEITRINCIFHDALGKAQPFGYVEVFKVIGLILPYFYKAFIRHEANLKNFPSKLSKFSHKYKNKVFDNPEINKGSFSLREIDSVVNGSLLELPKIKLILRRMYISIQSEKEDLRGTKEDEEDKIINESFGAAIDIIDAFGGANSFSNSEAVEERQRIFTPTGKILTQLATKWPAELQYGWLTRKVVGIFELRHVCPKQGSLQDTEVLIIFSDHLVFLTVVDDSYYVKRDDKSRNKKISISDILMHSLINEKPLPKLSSFPSMEVSAWCEINDVVVSSYKAPTMILTDSQPATGCQGDFLRFLNKTSSGYNTSNKDISFSRIYEVVGGSKSNSQQSGINIIDLVSKSKILHKSQPFHLFKSKTMGLNVYSTAHDFEAYQQETWKSPFAMFLNISFSDPYEYFEKNPDLYLLINASFLTDDKIQLIAYNRQKDH